jgi:predicted NUDIX family phosphoesterase
MAEVDGRILLMRRLARGGEKRLHQKLSIGVGGHINPEDLEGMDDRDPVRAGTLREIAEELDIRGETAIEAIGVLNDDSNAVGAVHVGLVQTLSVRGTVEIRERDVLEGRLVLPSELERLLEEGADFETWSERLVERIHEWVRDPLTA